MAANAQTSTFLHIFGNVTAALAALAFGPAEQTEAAAAEGFYRIWTLREAMAKATGEGLMLAANRCDLIGGDGSVSQRRIERVGRVWHLVHARIGEHSLAVAHADAPEPWGLCLCELA